MRQLSEEKKTLTRIKPSELYLIPHNQSPVENCSLKIYSYILCLLATKDTWTEQLLVVYNF